MSTAATGRVDNDGDGDGDGDGTIWKGQIGISRKISVIFLLVIA